MSGYGHNKKILSTTVHDRLRAYVALRARRRDWSPSKMTRAIIDHWFAEGAPNVSPADDGATALPWDAAIKWESLLEVPALPDREAMPRDNPLFARAVRR